MTGKATLIGFSAVAMWALLALFTAASGDVPPFQLAALSFAIATAVGLAWQTISPPPVRRQVPLKVWAFGVAGLFGYHFLYFTALRNAPAVEASLIAYLWPLLIVLGSAAMPGERLRWHHVAGALMGLVGTALLVTKDGSFALEARYAPGYAAALGCALVWSTYSLGSRRLPDVPTTAVTGFCAGSAVLAALCHLLMEETVWPASSLEWLAVLGLGLMPVGAAFYAWDHGIKHGNIQVLGASSYAAPLLSTLVLVAAGLAEPTFEVAAACLMITGGAALAARSMLSRKTTPGEGGRLQA
jgi:drug/metabolite transporter (DMT)-like permease